MTIGAAGIQAAVMILTLLHLLALTVFAGLAFLLIRRRRHMMTPASYNRILIGAGCIFLVFAILSIAVMG